MTELTEKEQETLNSSRMIRAESDVLLPLLQTKYTLTAAKIVSAFKAGQTEKLTTLAAELSTVYDMKLMIEQRINEAAYLEKKMLSDEGDPR